MRPSGAGSRSAGGAASWIDATTPAGARSINQPFILTATIPEPLRGFAEGLRRAHFPPERNHLHAHVTLFHAFAPSLREELATFIPQVAREYAAPEGRVTGLLDFGKGTAIRLSSPQLLAVRRVIAERFHGTLSDQDLHEPRLHITVQNKVTKEAARALQHDLAAKLEPWTTREPFAFPSLELHIYQGGPWEHLKTVAFRGNERL
ncbi:2'-5' RNA ligase family protein [Erythrobacter sp.]|jgi:hypothetical protein|uniref:2'-5' RNA ligase family protein n=1 Tax=Erythrobacter sp. TaxID=1042 RepID=UPI002ECC9794|nr:2'-5' RNA ligase family protein [Erythrobacter sp.]